MRLAQNRLFVLLATLVLAGSAAAESTAVVDFDTDPAGAAISSGSELNDLYAGSGVSFSWERGVGDTNVFCGGTPKPDLETTVYAVDPTGSATTDPNVISACPQSNSTTVRAGEGYFVALFEAPARGVCIDVIPSSSGRTGELIALALNGSQLDSDTDSSEACVSGDDNIWGVKFSGYGGSGGGHASFDTLRVIYGPIRVDFDTRPDGSDITGGSEINDAYQSQGVLFSRGGGTTACGAADVVYANTNKPNGFGSLDNAVSACAGANSAAFGESASGVIVASFFTDVARVCVDSLPELSNGSAFLSARAASGDVLQTVYTTTPNAAELLCVGPLAGIRSAEFAGEGTNKAYFDDFSFEFGGATVDFDEDPQGGTIADDSIVNDAYAESGVTFSRTCPGNPDDECPASEVYANSNTAGAVEFGSPPNTVSPIVINDAAFSESQNGLIEARFARLQESVCIDVRPRQANGWGVMRAYDDAGGELAAVVSAPGAIESLCVVEADIRSVEFAGFFQNRAYFDDLRYTAVPEPAARLLQGAALALLSLLGRRRSRPGA